MMGYYALGLFALACGCLLGVHAGYRMGVRAGRHAERRGEYDG